VLLKAAESLKTRVAQTGQALFSAASPVLGLRDDGEDSENSKKSNKCSTILSLSYFWVGKNKVKIPEGSVR
jgi:hypothetical protein